MCTSFGRVKVATKPVVAVSATAAPLATLLPTSTWCEPMVIGPGSKATVPRGSSPVAGWPEAACQRSTAAAVEGPKVPSTVMAWSAS